MVPDTSHWWDRHCPVHLPTPARSGGRGAWGRSGWYREHPIIAALLEAWTLSGNAQRGGVKAWRQTAKARKRGKGNGRGVAQGQGLATEEQQSWSLSENHQKLELWRKPRQLRAAFYQVRRRQTQKCEPKARFTQFHSWLFMRPHSVLNRALLWLWLQDWALPIGFASKEKGAVISPSLDRQKTEDSDAPPAAMKAVQTTSDFTWSCSWTERKVLKIKNAVENVESLKIFCWRKNDAVLQ